MKKSNLIFICTVVIFILIVGLGSIKEKSTSKVNAQTTMQKRTIVIDPGHGGSDSGAVSEGMLEKHINLQISRKVKQKLLQQGYTVIMTREQDEAVTLEERVRISNDSNADLFVSIHQNAIEDSVTHGIETWFERGNKDSKELANKIQGSIAGLTGEKNRGIKDSTSYHVTRNNNAPSVLVECGFITSDYERPLLSMDEYQEKIADGIVEGINQYLNKSN